MNKEEQLMEMYTIVLLALMIWREARGECNDGRAAVGYTVINRVAHPSWWGDNIVSVINKKYQYSSMTDPNDKQLTLYPDYNSKSYKECLAIAEGLVKGTIPAPLPGIDSYYAASMKIPPKWAAENPDKLVGKIGNHYFYNMDQDHEKVVIDKMKQMTRGVGQL